MKFVISNIFWLSLCCLLAGGENGAQSSPGESLAEIRRQLATAQIEKNHTEVVRAAERMRKLLGESAGIPEDAPVTYFIPEETCRATASQARKYWDNLYKNGANGFVWDVNPAGNPLVLDNGLRQVGRPIISFVMMAEVFPEEASFWLQKAEDAGQWLLQCQMPDGLFPFPDIRGSNPFFGPMIDTLLQQLPNALYNGWIIDDGGDGALQYDNAICGVAMLSLFRATGNEAYLNSALRSAEWARSQPSVPNWNYNAFSVWLLAEIHPEAQQRDFLEDAIEKARLGILPGQLANGRWMDPHNAKIVYHAIIGRALLALTRRVPCDSVGYDELHDALKRNLENAINDVMENGVSSASVLTEVLADSLYFGLSPEQAEAALDRLVCSAITLPAVPNAPQPGWYITNYLRANTPKNDE